VRLIFIMLGVFIILAALMPLYKGFEDDQDYSDLGEDDD